MNETINYEEYSHLFMYFHKKVMKSKNAVTLNRDRRQLAMEKCSTYVLFLTFPACF